MFYQFIDENNIRKAPKPLYIDGKDVFTNNEEAHNKQGYYKLILTEYPQGEKGYVPFYVLENNAIVQKWEEVESNFEEATIEDYKNSLTRLGVDVDE